MGYRNDFREAQKEFNWSLPRVFVSWVFVLFFLFLIGFISTGGNLALFKFWAPKIENAKREVFENTQSYVHGKVDYLSRLKYQYQKTEGVQKEALKDLILSEASNVDNEKLPYDLQVFINQLKGN